MEKVVNNAGERRYEIWDDANLAGFAQYRLRDGGRVVFVHAEVDPAYEGRGVGGRLVRTALDDVRRQGKVVVPLCPFVAAYIKRNPEYVDLVVPEQRSRVVEEKETLGRHSS